MLFHSPSGADPVLNPFPGSGEFIRLSQSYGSVDDPGIHKHIWNVYYKPRIGSYMIQFLKTNKSMGFVVVHGALWQNKRLLYY